MRFHARAPPESCAPADGRRCLSPARGAWNTDPAASVLGSIRYAASWRRDRPCPETAPAPQTFRPARSRARTLPANRRRAAAIPGPESNFPSAAPSPRGRQLHNAHHFEAVTIRYRWHPLCGRSLPVDDRKKTREGEYFVCRLQDQTTLTIPAWMLKPECAEFSLGPPLVAVEALLDLRELLTSLRLSSGCDNRPERVRAVDLPDASGRSSRAAFAESASSSRRVRSTADPM